jgi:hypothetical protein
LYRLVENKCFCSNEYIVPIASGNERDNIPVKVLTSRIIKLKKLQEVKIYVIETTGLQ